jgi:hypothetical protein
MYLYKLPEENQYIFIRQRSLYNLYKPKEITDLLLVPEKIYHKYEKHFGLIDTKLFRYSALEMLKEQFSNVFTSNQLNAVQKTVLGFFINQFKITKEQYEEMLQKALEEDNSFDLQFQLSKYQSIKSQYHSNSFRKLVGFLRF